MEILDLRKQLHRAAEETETAVKQLAREKTKVEKMNKAKVMVEYNKHIFYGKIANRIFIVLAMLRGWYYNPNHKP